MLKKIVNSYTILIILLIAVLLRVWGINYGFPFIFHPDEPTVVRSALGVRFFPNPGHFDWPHLHIYLNYFLFMGFARFRDVLSYLGLKSYFSEFWDDGTIFYLISRLFSALLGALTVIPIYLASTKFYGKRVGLISAALFSVIPFHVMRSHYALVDVPMVFWVSWALYFSSLIVYSSDVRNYILGGLLVGLAASTKYNGGLALLMIISAHLLRVLKDEKLLNIISLRNLLLAGIFSFSGFVLGTPYSILDFKTFIRIDGPKGALWQFVNVGSVDMFLHIQQFVRVLFVKLSNDLGYTILMFYLLGLAYIIFRNRSKAGIFLLVNSLFLIWYVSGFEKPRSHYLMISYPFIVILASYTAGVLSEKIVKKSVVLNYIFIVVILIIPFTMSLRETLTYAKPDTRNILYEWLVRNITDSDTIVYDGDDLTMIFKEFPQNYVVKTKNVELSKTRAMKGYLVMIVGGTDNTDGYFRIKPTTFPLEIKNKGNRGPEIIVYSLQEINND